MILDFPNPSRSYDASEGIVRFWGYDTAIEIAFFIETTALKSLCPEMGEVEAGVLEAFDSVRKRIHEVAEKVYVRGNRRSKGYTLAAKDF